MSWVKISVVDLAPVESLIGILARKKLFQLINHMSHQQNSFAKCERIAKVSENLKIKKLTSDVSKRIGVCYIKCLNLVGEFILVGQRMYFS